MSNEIRGLIERQGELRGIVSVGGVVVSPTPIEKRGLKGDKGDKGDTGNQGERGYGITSIVYNADYTLTITYADGETVTTSTIRGAKGDTGDKGDKGDKGNTGDRGYGITGITYNSDYTITITYADGQTVTTDSVRGATGDKGDKGDTGNTGATGNGIASAVLNADYTLTLTFTNGTTYTTPSIRGQQGAKGDTGATGQQGIQGETGATGNGIASISKTGASGLVDTYTITFTDGTTTTFTVTNGQDGQDGADGQDGFSPSASVSKSGSVATVTITDKDGTTTAEITDGEDGQDGYTPQKGVDYFDGQDGTDGQDGEDGFSPTASVSKAGKVATITITDKDGTTTVDVRDGEDGQGSGDMLKATYDTDNSGVVDAAESVAWSGVTNKPESYPPSSHNHDDRYYTENEADGKFALISAISDMATKTWVNAQGFITSLAGYATESWVNAKGYLTSVLWSDISDRPTALSDFTDDLGTSPTHTHSQYLESVSWGDVQSKPTEFNPTSHTHTKSQITDYDGISDAPSDHKQYVRQDGGWEEVEIMTSVDWSDVENKPSTFPPSSHDHDDRYYTEAETNTLLGGKSDTGHTHGFDSVTNRPSYNGSVMTSATSIPEVKTSTWDGKQDYISDLQTIRDGAALGATAIQSHQDISGKENKGKMTINGTEETVTTHTLTITNSGVTTSYTLLGL